VANSGRRRLHVVAALLERRGRVLLAQRRADQSLPLTWEFPGGKVEPGEPPEAALAREILEELGCEVRVGEVVETVRHAYPDFDLEMPIYRTAIVAGEPRAVTVAAVAWVPRREMPGLPMPPADRPFAVRLARTPARRRNRGTAARSSRRSSRPARRS
jgi:8-oxo-dGTP diphosphatase